MSAAERVRVKQTIAAACLPIVCVDSWIILTAEEAGPELRRFLELANDWESPFVRVYGGPLAEEPGYLGRVGKVLAPRDPGSSGRAASASEGTAGMDLGIASASGLTRDAHRLR
jgi:hypothetical protein